MKFDDEISWIFPQIYRKDEIIKIKKTLMAYYVVNFGVKLEQKNNFIIGNDSATDCAMICLSQGAEPTKP